MSVKVNELEIEVKSNLDDITESVGILAKDVGVVEKKFTSLASKTNKVKQSFEDYGEATGEVNVNVETIKESTAGLNKNTETIRKSISDLFKQVKKSFSGIFKFINSLKRVAFYRIIRKILSTITSGFKEGTENAYLFARAMGMDVAKKLDGISTSLLYFKNQMGAIGVQLLASVQPIITNLIDSIANLTETLTKFFAVLGGGKDYLIATKNAKAFAKAQRDILGFDEINKLSGDTTNNLYSFTPATMSDSEFENIKKKLETIKALLVSIGTVILGWKIGKIVSSVLTGLGLVEAGTTGLLSGISIATASTVGLISAGVLSMAWLIYQTWDEISAYWQGVGEKCKLLWQTVSSKVVENWRTAGQQLKNLWAEIKKNFSTFGTDLLNIGKMVVNGFITMINALIKGLNWSLSKVGNLLGKSWGNIKEISKLNYSWGNSSIKGYADGGYVNQGQLFLARENGAEMVGSIGNRTAVANNDQIVEAIKQGVYEAMSRANGNVNVTLQGDAKGLFKVIQQQAKQYAYATGNNAF